MAHLRVPVSKLRHGRVVKSAAGVATVATVTSVLANVLASVAGVLVAATLEFAVASERLGAGQDLMDYAKVVLLFVAMIVSIGLLAVFLVKRPSKRRDLKQRLVSSYLASLDASALNPTAARGWRG